MSCPVRTSMTGSNPVHDQSFECCPSQRQAPTATATRGPPASLQADETESLGYFCVGGKRVGSSDSSLGVSSCWPKQAENRGEAGKATRPACPGVIN